MNKEIKMIEENLGNLIKQGLDILKAERVPTDKQIEDWLEKNWDSNWHDSRTLEGELEWLKKFVREVIG